MSTQVQPLSKTVKDAVRRHKSPGRHVAPVLATVVNIVMFAAVCAACAAGAALLWREALQDPRFQMKGEMLGIGGAVAECPEAVPEIQGIGLRFSGRSLLDPMLVSDLEDAYRQSVWVKKVVHMRRNFPNRIDLELLLRIPAAQVRSGHRYWLIDIDGALLPVPGQEQPFANLPEIVGVTANVIAKRPKVGEIWEDEGVEGGMGILRVFWGSPLAETLPVRRIVVNTGVFKGADDSRVREIRRRFEVVTAPGAVIRWGTFAPGSSAGEMTSAEKMWNLQELLRRDEALRPGVCFDVRTRLPGYQLVE